MNIEKKYQVLGADSSRAKFIVSPTGPTGFLQIEFSGVFCKMRAPLRKLKFRSHDSAVIDNATDITYSSDMNSEVFWQVTVSKSDADELQRFIAEASSEMEDFVNR